MSNPLLRITTPKGTAYQYRDKNGEIKVRIEWESDFGKDWTEHLNTVQAKFDMEVLRVTDKYVSMDTGLTKNSAMIASNIGSGELLYNTPYAGWAYRHGKVGAHNGSLRGPYWGDRMKSDNLTYLANFVRKAVGKK